MGFFDALARGWQVTKASIKLISMDAELLLLPILSGLLMIGLIASFILPAIFSDSKIFETETYGYIFIAATYFASFFLLYFTQAMIVASAKKRLNGENPTLGSSFSAAAAHIGQILILSIIGAIIGVITSALRGKNGRGNILGSILSSIIGVAWTVISYFSIPIIMEENLGVFDSFKKSAELVGKAWGTGIAANVSLGLIMLPFFLLLVLTLASIFISPYLAIFLGILTLIALFVGVILQSVAKGIVSEVLYIYATTGKVPDVFPEDAVKNFYKGSANPQ